MRKWMRDRGKRRKKPDTTPDQPGQDKPAPLQPTFLDRNDYEVPDDIGNRVEDRPKAPAPQPVYESQPETEPSDAPAEAPAPTGRNDRSRRDRSRRRGRRGRGGKSPAQQNAPAPTLPINPGQATGEASEVGFDGAPATEPAIAPAPAEAKARQQQPKKAKGAVVLAIGLPGSGKSSWFKRHNIIPLSSDLVRGLLFDDATEQRYQDLVFSSLRTLLRARMLAQRPWNYIDATNLSPKERHSWIKMANDFGYEAHAVFFDVPTEVCMERNRRRSRNVPDEVMLRMAAKLRPPKFEEGFGKITVVRVKKSATASPEEPQQDSPGEAEE